jgi:three-Cys-motif partner protein
VPKDKSDFFKVKNEWSVIKDRLLGCYLTPYFQKILKTKKPTFYIDCFAGKGRFEDGNDGSPLIALRIRNDCLNRTTEENKDGAIKTCFIELNHVKELQDSIASIKTLYDQPEVLPGKFESVIKDYLQDKSDCNIFLYIDPYGIKALDSELFDSFRNYGFNTFEMLINFNSFGFFRDACRVMKVDIKDDEAFLNLDDLVEYEPTYVSSTKNSENLLTKIAGGDYWKDIVTGYKAGRFDGYKAEQILSVEYKNRLRNSFKYVLDMPIRLKSSHRPKYRMIHVCNHQDGCYLMAQNMQLRKDELFLNIQQQKQQTLFDFDSEVSTSVEGEFLTKDVIKDWVKQHLLKEKNDRRYTEFIATFVNDYGLCCDFAMIHDILDELEERKEIEIIRNPAYTKTGLKRKFWEEKENRTITIRRL